MTLRTAVVRRWVAPVIALLGACTLVALTRVPLAEAGTTRPHLTLGTTGADWPLYGANLANTRTSPGGPPKAVVAGLRQAWRFDAKDGDFTGTPVLAGGRVFVGSNGANGTSSTQSPIRALDEATGKVLWQTQVAGPVNASLAVVGGRVFVPVAKVGQPFVAALDAATGALLWQTNVDNQTDADLYGSPVVANGVVYQGWSALFGELHDSNVNVRGGVAAFDATTGALRWHTFSVPPGFNGGGIWSTPAVDLGSGALYVGTGNAYHAPAAPTTDSILKIRLLDGAIVGHFQATANDVFNGTTSPAGPDFDFGASPNLVVGSGGTPAVGEGQKSGDYWAVRRSDMQPLWHQQLGPGSAVGGILGSTAYDGTRIYGPITAPSYVWALAAMSGSLAWVSPVGDPVHWSPLSVSNGVAYSADSAGFVDAWDAATGVPMARVPLGVSAGPAASSPADPAFGGVALAGGTVFADTGTQSTTGAVVALRPAGTG